MSMHARALILMTSFGVWLVLAPPGVRADVITTSAPTIPLTPTNWGPGTGGTAPNNPLALPQFDTHGGALVLDSVTLNFLTKLNVDFGMTLVTPGTVIGSLATGSTAGPGPSITLFRPDGTTPFVTVPAPNEPSFLTKSYSYDGSNPTGPTTPLGPAEVGRSYSLTLTAPADLALFTGKGTVSLPVSATALEVISVSSGNGSGHILTNVGAGLSADYQYHLVAAPELVPEPSAVALWALAGVTALLALRRRVRALPA